MKLLPILLMAAMAIVSACSLTTGKDRVKNNLPGTYVHNILSKTGVSSDTLMIWQENAHAFFVLRKKNYKKVSGKRTLSFFRQRETWSCRYYPDRQILIDSKTGRVLVPNAEKHLLLVGSTPYLKVTD